ncbi:MAG: T9SS type A sorting domain-containing protein [Calditrichaeota bacterium]|nr:T9SS type A sorting domain-containing protein [Calditrichota bacterium]
MFYVFFLFQFCSSTRNSNDQLSSTKPKEQLNILEFKIDEVGKFNESFLGDSLVSDSLDSTQINSKIELVKNYPNPFSPTADVYFKIFETGDVTFELIDTKGKMVGVKTYPNAKPGKYKIDMSSFGLKSGLYYYRVLTLNTQTKYAKMLLIR